MTGETPLKTCFVIGPIGENESDTRKRSDQVLRHIIRPICSERGYQVTRADKISDPGIITSQIIERLANDDLVIADLTGKNPNVFYELAVRHAVRKPVIQMMHPNEPIPFDVAPTRAIELDYRDLDSVESCKKTLNESILSIEDDATQVDSPISVAIDIMSMRQSDDPIVQTLAEMRLSIQDIKSSILSSELETGVDGYEEGEFYSFLTDMIAFEGRYEDIVIRIMQLNDKIRILVETDYCDIESITELNNIVTILSENADTVRILLRRILDQYSETLKDHIWNK
jgi:hypothetical protein